MSKDEIRIMIDNHLVTLEKINDDLNKANNRFDSLSWWNWEKKRRLGIRIQYLHVQRDELILRLKNLFLIHGYQRS